ncbi:MAG TPA: hypothetical protein VJ654_06685 [Noviherbaspirillum sp.]|nr:hypothetical protein [Noviherbaspirillum sp.]
MQRLYFRLLVCLSLIVAVLGGCASYEVTGRSEDKAIPLEHGSVDIVWSKRMPESVFVKQTPGYGIEMAGVSDGELLDLQHTRLQVVRELLASTPQKVRALIWPYISMKKSMTKYVLQLEMNRVHIDVDGTRNITITATLSEPPTVYDYWSRNIQIHATRFSEDDVLSTQLAEAVVAQLRNSELIK